VQYSDQLSKKFRQIETNHVLQELSSHRWCWWTM